MSQEEIWRPINEFPDYQISNLAQVIHVERPNSPRKVGINHKGFPTIVLFNKTHPGSRYLRHLNRLVAEAFLPPPRSAGDHIWHIDGDLLNCQADNLQWDIPSRVREWNDMHREGYPALRTPKVLIAKTGEIYRNAHEAGLAAGETESAIVHHIESYPPHLADRARFQYVE